MSTGTAAHGKKSRGKSHIICRRCGSRSYHTRRKICSSCGFGKSKRRVHYNWKKPGKK